VNSFLNVPDAETLSIVGGDIGLYGAYLWAPGGRINLASMASPVRLFQAPPAAGLISECSHKRRQAN